MKIYIDRDMLMICESDCYDLETGEDTGEVPVLINLKDALEITQIPGFGRNLSNLIVEMSGYPWLGKEYIEKVLNFMRENFTQSKIDWQETTRYLNSID